MNRRKLDAVLSLTFGKAKTYFESVFLVFLVDVLDKGLEIFRAFVRFSGFSSHYGVLRDISGINYIIYRER